MRPRTLLVKISSTDDFRPALHVQHLLQADAAHHAAEALLRQRLCERVERRESGGKSLGGNQLFEKQRCAAVQAGFATLFCGAAGQDDYGLAGMGALQQSQELEPVHHGHVEVQHYDIHSLLLQERQRLGVVFRRKNLPRPAGHLGENLADTGEEAGIIIDKKEFLSFVRFA